MCEIVVWIFLRGSCEQDSSEALMFVKGAALPGAALGWRAARFTALGPHRATATERWKQDRGG